MPMDIQKQIAKEEDLSTEGGKKKIVKHIVDAASTTIIPHEDEPNILEAVLMNWKHPVQQEFLEKLGPSMTGGKQVLTERIVTSIAIGDAVSVVQEYRTWLATKDKDTDDDNVSNNVNQDDENDNKSSGGGQPISERGQVERGITRETEIEDDNTAKDRDNKKATET